MLESTKMVISNAAHLVSWKGRLLSYLQTNNATDLTMNWLKPKHSIENQCKMSSDPVYIHDHET